MQAKEAIRLLICSESQHEAETLTSLLRNAGHATRASLVQSIDGLKEKLNEQTWDVCLCRLEMQEVTGKDVLSEILRQGKDIPTIYFHDDVDSIAVEKALKGGAVDLVPAGEYNHILQVVLREIKNLKLRRELREAEALLREAEKRCQVLLESAQDAIAYVQDGMHLFVNDSYANIFGYEDADDLLTMPLMDMVSTKDQGRFKIFLKDFNSGKTRSGEFQCKMLNVADKEIDTRMLFARATYDDEPCIQVIIRANTGNADLEHKLKQISSQDLLTGLYNKQYFNEQLGDAVDQAVIGGAKGAIAYINIDNFGQCKGSIGIEGADLVICDVAHLIRSKCREEDLVARIGEDVFGILLSGSNAEQAQGFAEHIRKAIEEHLVAVDQRTIQVTVSIGLALINDSSRNPKEVLQHAHEASYHVRKLEGHDKGNGVYLYNPAQLAGSDSERLQAKVEEAINDNNFKLLFQPVINLRDEAGEHYETLLRLVDDGSDVSPQDFLSEIPTDLKRKVDRWVILNTSKRLAKQRSEGNDTRLFINLTNESLIDESLIPWLQKVLQASKVPSGSMIFQFSESDAINHLKQAQAMTKTLAKLGCKVAITRFGSGIDPFKLFEHLHVDLVKIDGSFTKELNTDKGMDSLKELLAKIGEYEKASIVPFVENANIVAQLWTSGVSFIQGYYLQGPTEGMDYEFNDE
ncbi:EAL domain-containing protein [Bermanella marisrubri]|uniref:Predicted signal transduction protein containing a membrane domain, an EAL and a GGDEF domain n=1 Tax=Bermanella marisrubri TaxID=207949 RepID=Q1N218_9GAMM|nr:EAL domain-containing protein [Bermanella marisrubri]EAT12346.1 predicted signal transduction protein containing a membrane domain, an EAL and a GGDEF domain [Bermanella marisrubri]QIZ85429.1 EAL domain-containing protein [Bermanella marisrubri]